VAAAASQPCWWKTESDCLFWRETLGEAINIANYYGDMTQRELVVELANYLAKCLYGRRPDEASAARVLRELLKNQRLG